MACFRGAALASLSRSMAACPRRCLCWPGAPAGRLRRGQDRAAVLAGRACRSRRLRFAGNAMPPAFYRPCADLILAPSVRCAKPATTTRSVSLKPLRITASASSCWATMIGTQMVLASPMT